MQTLNDFLHYRNICPLCDNKLTLFLHNQLGSIILYRADETLFTFTRAIKKRIIDGGGTDYVINGFLNTNHSFSINFSKDIYSDHMDYISINIINHFTKHEIKRLPGYMISNACSYCDYEYSAFFYFDYSNSQFNINKISREVFAVSYGTLPSYYVVNNFDTDSSQILLITDNRDFDIYPLRHWLIRFAGTLDSIPANRHRLLMPNTCNPFEAEKNEQDFKTLFLFS